MNSQELQQKCSRRKNLSLKSRSLLESLAEIELLRAGLLIDDRGKVINNKTYKLYNGQLIANIQRNGSVTLALIDEKGIRKPFSYENVNEELRKLNIEYSEFEKMYSSLESDALRYSDDILNFKSNNQIELDKLFKIQEKLENRERLLKLKEDLSRGILEELSRANTRLEGENSKLRALDLERDKWFDNNQRKIKIHDFFYNIRSYLLALSLIANFCLLYILGNHV